MGLDTATANGRLMLNVLGSVAQFEREVMLERQREGSLRPRAKASSRAERPQRAGRLMRSRLWPRLA
jgi:DNA invertase Pin-like site-specific DNA recombinase